MDNRLKKQLSFSLEIDKEKNIFRQTHLSCHGRNENDAEHAWHMAIMAYLLKEYANEKIDIAKVILMCLIHDVVEIDAGDTYTYDAEAKFAHALDNFQPLMLNHSNGGEDWKAHNVTAAQVYGRHNSTKYGSETLFEITEQIIQENIKKGTIKPVRFYKTGGYNRKFKDVKKHE